MKSLIVDDEKHVKTAITMLGHWNQFQLEIPAYARNGVEALSLMEELHPKIVFVDMNMPQMNGLDFLKIASVKHPTTKFIVVSGYDDFSYAQQAIHYGISDYILKPIDEDCLNNAISNAISKINFSQELPILPSERKETSAEEVVEIIKTYMENNYHETIKVTMFAEKYYYSVEYLNKIFRQKYDCTIYDYLLKIRLSHAKELLKKEDIKINDIAKRLGYTDSHYFSKAFRAYYHITPSQFREEYLCQNE